MFLGLVLAEADMVVVVVVTIALGIATAAGVLHVIGAAGALIGVIFYTDMMCIRCSLIGMLSSNVNCYLYRDYFSINFYIHHFVIS